MKKIVLCKHPLTVYRLPFTVYPILGLLLSLLGCSAQQNVIPTSVVVPPHFAHTFFVAPHGDDRNAGTENAPFATLNHAISQTQPDSVIFVRAGTYKLQQAILWQTPSGTANQIISLQAYPNEEAIFDCQAVAESCFSIQAQFIEIKGLTITNAQRSGIVVWNGQHIQIRNNTIQHSQNQGIYVSANPNDQSRDIVIDRNTLYRNSAQFSAPIPIVATQGWHSGIGIAEFSANITITNNLVYENYGEGIINSAKESILIQHNVVHDNFSANIYLDGASNTVVDSNFIYSENNPTFFRYAMSANGIALANEQDSEQPELSNNLIQNNIVVGCRYGLTYGAFLRGGGMKQSQIRHNVFYGGIEAVVQIEADQHEQNEFYNNIVLQNQAKTLIVFSTDGFHFANNAWSDSPPSAVQNANDLVIADPQFIHAGAFEPSSYQLQAESPLIDAGTPNDLAFDFWATPRPQGTAPDIGTFEWIDK